MSIRVSSCDVSSCATLEARVKSRMWAHELIFAIRSLWKGLAELRCPCQYGPYGSPKGKMGITVKAYIDLRFKSLKL